MLLIAKLIDYYSVVVIVAVFLSWLQLPPSNQVVRHHPDVDRAGSGTDS